MTSTTAVVDMESWGEYMCVQEIPPWPIKFSLQGSGTQIMITRFLTHLLSLLLKHREENQKRQILSWKSEKQSMLGFKTSDYYKQEKKSNFIPT